MNSFSTKSIILIISFGLIFCVFIYLYYNRLEKIRECQGGKNHFNLYIDWKKSNRYNLKKSERNIAQNYFIVTKNGKLYFRFQDNSPYEEYFMPYIGIHNDSLVIYKRGGAYDSDIYLKMPVNRDRVLLKDTKMVILSQWFKSGLPKDSINPNAKGFPNIYRQQISPDSAKVQNIFRDY
jgi:hypothetical protein